MCNKYNTLHISCFTYLRSPFVIHRVYLKSGSNYYKIRVSQNKIKKQILRYFIRIHRLFLLDFQRLIHTNSASIQAVLDIVGFYQDITGNTNPNLIWEKFNNAKLTKTQPKAPTAGSRSPPPHTDKAFENPVSKELSNTRTCVVPVEN